MATDGQMSAKTKNLFGKAQFDAMKQGSVFVNTARYVAVSSPCIEYHAKTSKGWSRG